MSNRHIILGFLDVITQAMKEKKNAAPADQLEYAVQLLRSKTTSGSGTVYANGLDTAAQQVMGKSLDTGTIMTIIQSLMGSTQEPAQQTGQAAGGDMLGSLMVNCWAAQTILTTLAPAAVKPDRALTSQTCWKQG